LPVRPLYLLLTVIIEFFSILDGAPGMIRTCDTRIRNPVLYPLSYGGRRGMDCCAEFFTPIP
jgi:hypothetical protein